MVQLVFVSAPIRLTACQHRLRLRDYDVLTSEFGRYDLMSDMA